MVLSKNKRTWLGVGIIIALLAGIYVYSQYNPENSPFFPQCPVYALTGYKCPGCGSQRAFHHLFQGDFLTAFRYNPFMLFLAAYVLLGVYIEYIAGKSNLLVARLRTIFFGKWAILVLATIILLYTVIRNISPFSHFFPE